MANWGVPDYNARTPEQQAIDREAPNLRARLEAEGHLTEWPSRYAVEAGYPPHEVRVHCVEDKVWQQLRLSLKGIPTHEKLGKLAKWWEYHHKGTIGEEFRWACEVQVGNYLGALRRGGQLDERNRIRKYI